MQPVAAHLDIRKTRRSILSIKNFVLVIPEKEGVTEMLETLAAIGFGCIKTIVILVENSNAGIEFRH